MTDTNRELDARVAVARGWTEIVFQSPFSTDIAAAWVLVEEIITSPWRFDLLYRSEKWQVELDDLRDTLCFCGATAPEAICHAYLEWKARE